MKTKPEDIPAKIADLKNQRKLLVEEQRRLEGNLLAERNKDEERRRDLVGGIVILNAAKDPNLNALVAPLLAREVTRAKDRLLFGLPPLEDGAVGKGGVVAGTQGSTASKGSTSTDREPGEA